MKKLKISVIIVVLMTLSLIVVAFRSAVGSVAKPSVPEFTAKYIDNSYDVPPTYGTNPYNGQPMIIQYGHHVDERSYQVTIENQPFTPYFDTTVNQTINLFYLVETKGHFAGWVPDGTPGGLEPCPAQTPDSDCTVVFIPEEHDLPPNSQTDIRVRALIGYFNETPTLPAGIGATLIEDGYYTEYWFVGQQGDWSSTQTVTICANTNNATSSSTPQEPTAPQGTNNSQTFTLTFTLLNLDAAQLTILSLVCIIAGLLIIVVAYSHRRKPRNSNVVVNWFKKACSAGLLVTIMLSGSIILPKLVPNANAESAVPKPSIPEFTAKFVDHSYDVPTTYSTDPYTGEKVTHAGYRVENITLDVTIKNQPFTPYTDGDWRIGFFYNIREKGYYSEDWSELYRASDGYPPQSGSECTVISLGTLEGSVLRILTNAKMFDIPSGGLMDLQVEAMIGHVSRKYNPNTADQLQMYPWVFTGETSGWSTTQTLKIGTDITVSQSDTNVPTTQPDNSVPATLPDASNLTTSPDANNPTTAETSPTSKPDQTTKPTTDENVQAASLAIVGVGVVLVLVSVGLLVYSKKRINHKVGK